MSALWHHEQHRLGLAAVGFEHEGVRMSKSAPCTPMKAQSRPHDPLGGLLAGFEANGAVAREANDFHVMHKVPVGDSPYVRAKHVQVSPVSSAGWIAMVLLLCCNAVPLCGQMVLLGTALLCYQAAKGKMGEHRRWIQNQVMFRLAMDGFQVEDIQPMASFEVGL